MQATAFSLKLVGAAALAFQVPWNPSISIINVIGGAVV